MSEIDELRKEVERLRAENETLKKCAFEFGEVFSTKVNEMRAREEWLARELAAQGNVYGYEPYCPMPGDYECEWRQGCDLCGATIKARAECWRKAAEMETREFPGKSGNFPENEGGDEAPPEMRQLGKNAPKAVE